jgi:hypothetical protein
MSDYALAGIPWYWLVWVSDNQVTSIEVHVLDHALSAYRLHQVLEVNSSAATLEVPIRIKIQWDELTDLTL